MALTESEQQLIDQARKVGPALRAGAGDRDRLAGWLLKELADLAERSPQQNSGVVLDSQLARAAQLAKAMPAVARPGEPGGGEWTAQDVINVALGRGMDALERLHVKNGGNLDAGHLRDPEGDEAAHA